MPWGTSATVRSFINITSTSVISDADVTTNIGHADREIRKRVFAYNYDERLQGSIDGTNKEFKTKYKPIADGDMDQDVDSSDVTGHTTNIDSVTVFRETSSAAVTSVNARDGIITLTIAPAADGTVDEVTLDYYSINPHTDMNDVYRCSSILAAVFCLMQLSGGSAGFSYTAGRFSVTKGQNNQYSELMGKLIRMYEMLVSTLITEISLVE